MNKLQKFIAKIFKIKSTTKTVYTLNEVFFNSDDYKNISTFLSAGSGNKLVEYMALQKIIVADKSSTQTERAEHWQGFCIGYKTAINNLLQFRTSYDKDITPSDSREVGLEELANIFDQTER